MDSEKLHFKIGLTGTYWEKLPKYRVLFNDKIIDEGTATSEIKFIEFDLVCQGTSTLKIQLTNKEDIDTVIDQSGSINKDMLLNIHSLEIDEIDISTLLHSHSDYLIDKEVEYQGKKITSLKKCINLGWNGTWIFTFTYPFYSWLLETF